MVSFESETDLCINPAAMETVVVAGLIVRPIGGAVMHLNSSDYGPRLKKTYICCMQMTKAQTSSLCICTVWSPHLLLVSPIMLDAKFY